MQWNSHPKPGVQPGSGWAAHRDVSHHMKIVLTLIVTVLISIVAIASINSSNNIALKFDKTTICVPKEYVPGLSIFGLYLRDYVGGFDESGKNEIIRLPASLIMSGVDGYKFSHINKHNVNLEHQIGGIAHNLSNVGNPSNETQTCAESLGYCYQSAIYKDVYYQYTLQTVEMHLKKQVRKYLVTLFEEWERNCEADG